MFYLMEIGLCKDVSGKLVFVYYIEIVKVSCKGKDVLIVEWGLVVLKNLFLVFKFKGGIKGDKVLVIWCDMVGEICIDEVVIS